MDSKPAHLTDEQLVEQLRRGDDAAFEAVYRQYFRMTAGQVAQFGRADIMPEDVFQEAVVVLARMVRRDGFQLTSKLSTLLFGISRNVLLQKSGRRSEILVEDAKLLRPGAATAADADDDEKEAAAEREAMLDAIEAGMGLLADDCRDLLNYSFFEKLPQVEIAARMGYAEAFVKVKKFRCLEYLRKKVKASLGITD